MGNKAIGNILLFLCTLYAAAHGITITENGTAKTIIVIDSSASDTVRYAADELQTYLQQVTGVALTIANEPQDGFTSIFIGKNLFTDKLNLNTDDLKSDGFKIVSGNHWLAILGRDYSGPPICTPPSPFQYNQVYNEQLNMTALNLLKKSDGVSR
jgi:hypothetical protein